MNGDFNIFLVQDIIPSQDGEMILLRPFDIKEPDTVVKGEKYYVRFESIKPAPVSEFNRNNINMQLTKNFNLSEFNCKDGTPVPDDLIGNVQELADNLQVLRDDIKKPVRINSAYRHEAYNKKIGGAPSSQHIKAKASDIVVEGFTPKQLAARIEKLIKAGKMKQGGIGIYPTFVHYDIRGVRARW